MSEELTILPAARLVELMRARAVSPVEVLEAHLRRAARLNPQLNAVVTFADDALEAARAAEREIMRGGGGDDGRTLLGLPVTVKDTFDTRGSRTTRGSRVFAEHVPARDAHAVARLRAAGAVVFGKTNTSELALDYTTDNPLFGRTLNPHDAARTPGGSSGGCAAAVAACLTPASLGSDMAGSIRIPAHFCGVAGLKPTAGRVHSTGHFPPTEGLNSLSATAGPLARTVEDLALVFDALTYASDASASAHPRAASPSSSHDASSSNSHDASFNSTDVSSSDSRSALAADKSGASPASKSSRAWLERGPDVRRVAFYTDDGVTPVCEDARRAVEAAARALREAAGPACELAEELPPGVERGAELWRRLFARPVRELVRETYRGREGDAGPAARALLGGEQDSSRGRARSSAADAEDFFAAWRERDELLAGLLRWMELTPIFVAPVGASAAFAHGARRIEVGGRLVSTFRAFAHAQSYSALGLPVVTLPAWRTHAGLPVGVQIVGRPHEERRVLAAARSVERALGGWQPPPISLPNA